MSSTSTYANETICSINDFMSDKRCLLPAVVRVAPSDYEIPDNDEVMPRETEMLLDKLDQVKYARIKVLPFINEERVITFKGIECVRLRSELVGREFFLPAEYHGNVRCIPRPGYRKSFTTIAQVLKGLPRYVKVSVDTPSCSASGQLDLGPKVPTGTVLQLRKMYTLKNSTFRHLTCSHGNQQFHFREDQHVRMDALGDGQLHRWSELQNLAMLPVYVQFDYAHPNDIICEDDDMAASLLTVLNGPIEVTQFVAADMLLAWASNGENIPCTKVLLLRKLARDVKMSLQASLSDDDGRDYIDKHFNQYGDTQWLRSSMYALMADLAHKEKVISLKRQMSNASKPVALIRSSVRPAVPVKPGCIATNEETTPPPSPKQSDLPAPAETDAKWMEWKNKIKCIHKDLTSYVRRRSSTNLQNPDNDYLTCIYNEPGNEYDETVVRTAESKLEPTENEESSETMCE